MSKAPAFQLYAKDILSDTLTWTAQELGVYMRLLMWSWDNGPIPESAMRRDRIDPDCSQCWSTVATKWQPDGNGGLTNPRLEKTRAEMEAYRQRQSERGKRSAEARASKPRRNQRSTSVQTPVQPTLQPDTQPNVNNKAGVGVGVDREFQEEKEHARKVLFSNSVYSDVSKATNELPELVSKGANIAAIRDSIRNWSDAKDERRTNRGWLATYRTFFERDRAMPMRTRPDQTGQRETLKTEWV